NTGRGIDRGTDFGRTRRGAIADRDQVQPRGGDQYAEGVGGREVQGTGREIHRRQGQGRSLSELATLQGQGRAGGAATRRGEGAGSPVPFARLYSAGDGVLRSLSGAADRRGRWSGEHLVEHLHPENA